MEKARLKADTRLRLKIVASLVTVAMLALVGGLFFIQIVQHDEYLERAARQQRMKVQIEADRGRILDRNGVALALSRDRFTLNVDRRHVGDIGEVAAALSVALGCDRRGLERRIRTSSRNPVTIERKMSRRRMEAVEAIGLPGVYFDLEKERYYPYGALAAQVVGYAGMDNEGLEGIEGRFEDDLSGENGVAILQRDGHGNKRINPDFPSVPPRSGRDVVLTLDAELQELAENALDHAIEACGAKRGCVVIMDPYKGEILALAGYPRIDLNRIGDAGDREEISEAMRNLAITDHFEPGSTFKIVTLASVIEKGLANLDERIYCENGEYAVGRHVFHDIHEYEWLKVREVFELSSNIGVIKLAERLEEKGLYQMARRFGFGSRTGIEFPGEAPGMLSRLDRWSGLSLASISIGQEICVTALQMAVAYSAVANGGLLMKPTLVKAIWDSNGDRVYESRPEVIREVMSRETSDRLKEVLVGVVERGTGRKARVDGIEVAGKTGTAQKSVPGRRGYAPGKCVTTFGGFFPARNPAYVVYAMLDEPARLRWGGESAAPLVREVIASTASSSRFAYEGLFDRSGAEYLADGETVVEDRFEVIRIGPSQGEDDRAEGGEAVDLPVFELDYTARDRGDPGREAYPFVSIAPARGRMPDLTGLSVREAFRDLSARGLRVRVEGMGPVVEQVPAAGQEYSRTEVCIVRGEPF